MEINLLIDILISAIFYLAIPLIARFALKEKFDSKNAWLISIGNFIVIKIIMILISVFFLSANTETYNFTSGWIYIIAGYFILLDTSMTEEQKKNFEAKYGKNPNKLE